MIKTIRKKITVCIIFFMVLSIFCCVDSQQVSAKEKHSVMAKKQGIEYTKSIHIKTHQWGRIFINTEQNFKIANIKTDSKYIKTEVFGNGNDIEVDTCRQGTYHVTYEVKQKKKTVKLKTTVYVTDEIMPFKSITIGGKKLKKVKGGYWRSTYTKDGFYCDDDYPYYYSSKYKGKMKITPKSGYRIKGILIGDTDHDSFKRDIECYSRGIDFENDEVENGDYVELNYIASGVNEYEYEGASDTSISRWRDEYKYKTAYTHVSICYWDKYLKANAWMEIVICVDAVK